MLVQKKIAGLEISPEQNQVVELTKGSPKPKLINLGSEPLPKEP